MSASARLFVIVYNLRLRRLEELTPPVWPVTVLQKITKYVFETGTKLPK